MKFQILKSEKISISVCVILFFVFNIIIFAPLELYLTNNNEFWFSIELVWWWILLLGIFSFFVLFVFIMILRGNLYKFFVGLIFGVGLGFYIQGNFMNLNYGVLDGKEINWNSYGNWGLINSIIWTLCIIIPIIILKVNDTFFKKFIKYISLFIFLIQFSTLIFLLFTIKPIDSSSFYLSNEKRFELSSKDNIVVFILDSFDNRYFKEIVQEDKSFKRKFEDFTYFIDYSGAYPTTKGSLPFMLTGKYYEDTEPYKEYINKAFQETDFYSDLLNKNFDTRILTSPMYVDSNQNDKIDNIILDNLSISSYKELAKLMYKFVAFRYMPHLLKSNFVFYSSEFEKLKDTSLAYYTNDLEFYNSLINDKINIQKSKNCFRLYHLRGPHAPYNLDENLVYKEDSNLTWKDQAKASLNIVYEYIQQLKALNIYDNTKIIITSDHGGSSFGMPILLVKPQNTKKEFEVSYAQVSHANLHATIMDGFINDYKKYGESVFDIKEGQKITRRHLIYSWNNDLWNADYFPEIIEYEIIGDSNLKTSFLKTGNIYTNNGLLHRPNYKLGEELYFKLQGKANQYFDYGISHQESNFSWTSGTEGQISLEFQDIPQHDLKAIFTMSVIANNSQKLIIKVEDNILYEKDLFKAEDVNFEIPLKYINNNKLVLNLEYPNAQTPRSGDTRELAFAFRSMKFE